MKEGQPVRRPGTYACDQFAHSCDLARPSGDHRQLTLESSQVEPADDAVSPLLEQKCSRSRLELLADETELALREPEADPILVLVGVAIREEHLGGRLLDDGATDRALQHVAEALRGQAHDAVVLAPGLGAILGEASESRIVQQSPELIHPA